MSGGTSDWGARPNADITGQPHTALHKELATNPTTVNTNPSFWQGPESSVETNSLYSQNYLDAVAVGLSAMEGRGFYYPTDTAIAPNGRLYVPNRSVDGATHGRLKAANSFP